MASKVVDEWVYSACDMCYNCCPIKVHLVNGVAVKIEGVDSPTTLGKVCAKGNAGLMNAYNSNRVKTPLKRTNPNKGIGVNPGWMPIGWDEALDIAEKKIREARAKNPKSILFATFDIAPLSLLTSVQAALGTPHMTWGGSYWCGAALHPVVYIMNHAFQSEPDLDHCKYLLLIGTQYGFMTAYRATGNAKRMADARMRGMRLVVIDPICSNAASKADEWIPIRPGTDAALMLGMVNVILHELNHYDRDYIREYTNGPYLLGSDGLYLREGKSGKPLIWDSATQTAKPFDASKVNAAIEGEYNIGNLKVTPAFEVLKRHVKRYTPEMTAGITTIPASTIRRLAHEFHEAAEIGNTITIDNVKLPYRPTAALYYRGMSHKHGIWQAISVMTLNAIVGALDVPGGLLGIAPVGPDNLWAPREGPDGLMASDPRGPCMGGAYPPREVKAPETYGLEEICPSTPFTEPMYFLTLNDPEMYRLKYRIELMIHCRTNLIASTVHPEFVADALRSIPYIISFAPEIDETVEFADLVLPDTSYLESLAPFAGGTICSTIAGMNDWCWSLRQPAVKPMHESKYWLEVLLDLMDRLGLNDEFNMAVNAQCYLEKLYVLSPNRKYSLEEIADRWLKSRFGEGRGLNWFKTHGVLPIKKKVSEAYLRPFNKIRVPIYWEFLQRIGEEVKHVTEKLEIPWDTSGYQALPDWKPCPSHEVHSSEYDLYAVNFRLPYHTFSQTNQNPWLIGLSDRDLNAYPILINIEPAQRKGIREGDKVVVRSIYGDNVKGVAHVTSCIHPEVVGISGTFGAWSKGRPLAHGKGSHFNRLFPRKLTTEFIDTVTGGVDACIRVNVSKQ